MRSIPAVTTRPIEWRTPATPAAESHSFITTPPWTKPAEFASVGPSQCTSTASDWRTDRASTGRGIPSRHPTHDSEGGRRGRRRRTLFHRHQGEDQQDARQGGGPGRDARVLLPAADGAA